VSLKTIPLELIDFGERKREEYGDIKSLAKNIEKNGLIHPIAVTTHSVKDCEYLLAAGGRRLKAVTLLGWEYIECKVYDEPLSDFLFQSIELEENLQRKELTVRESAMMYRALHELYIKEKGAKTSTAKDAPGHTMTDTAKVLGIDQSTLSKKIKLANDIDTYEEASGGTLDFTQFSNEADTLKFISKIKTTLIRKELSVQADKKINKGGNVLINLKKSYIHGDFFEGVKKLDEGIIDLVEIDPPYAIDLTKNKRDYKYDEYNEVDKKDYYQFMMNTFNECYRVMKVNSWLICWHGNSWQELIKIWLIDAGFSVCSKDGSHQKLGLWVKPSGQTNKPEYYLGNAYEQFFYAWKGRPEIMNKGRSNTFVYNPIHHSKKIHPTERPLGLMRDILSTFTMPHSTVVVPFLGSGKTLIAAHLEKMHPFGWELSPSRKEDYTIMIDRMNEDGEL